MCKHAVKKLPYIWFFFFLNHPRKRVFQNVSLSNLGNGLQKSLRTDRARESIFRVPGGKNFENFTALCQPWWQLWAFDICNSLLKKLWICHCLYNFTFDVPQLDSVMANAALYWTVFKFIENAFIVWLVIYIMSP